MLGLRLFTMVGACVFVLSGLVGSDAIDPAFVTHGDRPPPGVDVTRQPSLHELLASTGLVTPPGSGGTPSGGESDVPPGEPGVPGLEDHVSPTCSGTGRDGNRVQVIYAVEQGKTDRYDSLLPSLRSWVADVDDTFAVSARKTGADLRVRWVHEGCVPVIAREVLPSGTLQDGFYSMIKELRSRGYDDKARKYLVFADSADLCGYAQIYLDNKKESNTNDGRYPMFGRVDSPCWAFRDGWHSTAAHEVMHMLGSVHRQAPNSTDPGVHCTDERDVMCYDDGSGSRMRTVCPSSHEALFDCGDDDYFNPRPPGGSYLAEYWNTADSSFLDDISRYPTKVSASVSPKTVTWGAAAMIEGDVTRSIDGAAAPDEVVKLYWRKAGTTSWTYVDETTTTSTGSYSFSDEPQSHGEYVVRFRPETAKYAKSNGPIKPVTVRHAVLGSLPVPAIVRDVGIQLSGSVGPNSAGDVVHLQRREGDEWETVASTELNTGSRYSFTIKESKPGTYVYRVFKPAGDDHAAGWTPNRSLVVL